MNLLEGQKPCESDPSYLVKLPELSDIPSGNFSETCDSDQPQIPERADFLLLTQRWVEQVRLEQTQEPTLISFMQARDIVKGALLASSREIEIPLLPSFGSPQEALELSQSIVGASPAHQNKRTRRLFSRILSSNHVEIKVDETKIRNIALVQLLKSLRQEIPNMHIELLGRWSKDSGLGCPVYFIQMRIKAGLEPINIYSQETSPSRPVHPLEIAKLKAREGFALPADASDRHVERERQHALDVEADRKLFNSRHAQLIADPTSLNSFTLIGPSQSAIHINPEMDFFSKYRLSKFRIGIEAFVSTTLVSIGIGVAAGHPIEAIAWGSVSLFGAMISCLILQDKIGLLHRRIPVDPINSIQSPSIRKFVEDIKELGYSPELVPDYSNYYRLAVYNRAK